MESKRRLTTTELAISGILLALILAALYLAALIPAINLTLWAVAGAIIYFAYRRFSPTTAAMLYGGSAILGFVIVPDKVCLILYILFFGIFALIKPIAEELAAKHVAGISNNPVIRPFSPRRLSIVPRRRLTIIVAYLLKLLMAAVLITLALILMYAIFTGKIPGGHSDGDATEDFVVGLVQRSGFFGIVLPVGVGLVMFLIYDYMLWLICDVIARAFKHVS